MASQIERDIRLRQRVLKKYEKAERDALRDIARRGAAVVELRGDSNGKQHEKTVPNPSIRIARECRTAIAGLKKQLVRLESQLAEATAAPKELSKLEGLAARAERLRT